MPPPKKIITPVLEARIDVERFVTVMLNAAYAGDVGWGTLVLRYLDGVPTQQVDLTAQVESSSQVHIYLPSNGRRRTDTPNPPDTLDEVA